MEVFTTGEQYKEVTIYKDLNVGILKEAEGGIVMIDTLRLHGIGGATFYRWRSKYGGLEASELKLVKKLEHQLSKYKTMAA